MLTLTYGIEVWSRVPRHKHIALQASDRIWTISNYTADQLISIQNVHRRSIQVVPVPIDPDFYADITTLPAAPTPFVHTRLLSISRLNATETDKGIDQVILALPNVRRRIPDVNYIVIGDGADRQRLERLATTVGVQDIVQFVGRVPDQQLYAYLSGTDLFVLPSRKEGFGIVFIEAMACGKAVIAGAHGGSPEVIVNGETGILVRHGDQVALASAITSLLQDDQKRQAMGDAGRRRIASVYSYNHFRLRVQETLDLLLCNRSK
jgi:glycosyltransferase involved in cell wall biosynthesis